jgi:AbrB family looped-hinge helix DNA binding protein
MRVAIDAVGRVIIPKPIRKELGIEGASELELTAADGFVELSVPDVPARVEDRDGVPVIVPETSMPPLTVEQAREAVDRTRR